MIVFDLKCGGDHVFEAWFGSTGAFEDQRQRGMVVCPMCGSANVAKAVMAPNVSAKGNQRSESTKPQELPLPETMKAAIAALAQAQSRMLEKSQWVGTAFADRARAMHLGETPTAQIHGQATADEAKALVDEGVPVAPLLLPVVPPEAQN